MVSDCVFPLFEMLFYSFYFYSFLFAFVFVKREKESMMLDGWGVGKLGNIWEEMEKGKIWSEYSVFFKEITAFKSK